MSHRFTRALGASLLVTALATSLVACGGEEAGTTTTELSATEHNDADVAFARDMVQHHAQAVAMVAASRHGLAVSSYAPRQVKQAVTDYGGSSKEQVHYRLVK